MPLAYAAFAFALGVAAGLLIRRTLPAMATTLVAFVGARVATRLPVARLQTAFGISLIVVAGWFFVHRVLHVPYGDPPI